MNSATILHGDCRAVLETLGADSVDAVVTDPPYELAFMNRRWDATGVACDPDTWRAVYRVLKPGGHMLVFGGTRTQHRMVCAIEDAGFEIRDTVLWVYASGFPKSLDVSKAIDATIMHGGSNSRRIKQTNETRPGEGRERISSMNNGIMGEQRGAKITRDAPATPEAAQWSGWGTALKPAVEMICLARKPLACRTVAANVLRHGTGALNIDACRIAGDVPSVPQPAFNSPTGKIYGFKAGEGRNGEMSRAPLGRWPANIAQDAAGGYTPMESYGDTGSAARFFFSAKADAADRADSRHPTVKPIDLMRWLVRLITPPGGHVLDPFAGSGTTAEAAMLEGFEATLIEQDATHVADIRHRQQRWHGGDMPLFAAHPVADPADERQAELWREPLAAD